MFYGSSESRAMNEKELKALNKPSKRERKIFPNAMLAHVWANESQHEGKNANGSMFFIDNMIYSYGFHYLAGKIYTKEDGTKYALLNDKSYSVTTSGHMSDIRSALKGKMEFFYVANPSNPLSEDNKTYLENELCEKIASLFETRKKHYSSVESIKKLLNENNTLLNTLGHEPINITQEQLNDLEFLENEREALNNCPIKNAKRDKVKAKRKLDLEIQYANQIAVYRTFNNAQSIKDFRDFKTSKVHTSVGYDHPAYLSYDTVKKLRNNGIDLQNRHYINDFDLLRVKDNIVQTSNALEVPLSHAIRLLKMILNNEAMTGERVGLFTLDSIIDDPENDKTIKIGCHKILLSEAVNVLKPYMMELVK